MDVAHAIPADLDEVLEECYNDTALFAKTLFPELFFAQFTELHDQIFELIDSGAPKIAIAAPRGLGKTTIARTVAAKGILYRDKRFIPYIGQSATIAEMHTEGLKRELRSNNDVRDLFGDVKTVDYSDLGLDDTFSKLCWAAFGECLVMPRGAHQQIRGQLWGKYRPDLIIIDDLENKDEIQNEENRRKLRDWFFSDLMKCISRYDRNWRFIYIDTLKHEDSLLQRLLDSSDWESLHLSVCDENYKSLAPSYMTDEEIAHEVEVHREEGILDIFAMEYMNLATSKEDASFKQEYFKYYNESELLLRGDAVESVVIVDPAKTKKIQSAPTAIVGIGLDYSRAMICVRDVINERLYPDQIYDQSFGMAERLGARVLAIEVTSLNEFITQPVRNKMMHEGVYFELVELHARGGTSEKGKIERIKSLVPYYRQGFVYHNRTSCRDLEQQLLAFPRSKRWDVMDATAYIVELMQLGERFFEAKPKDGKLSEDYYDTEDEFAELENSYDPPLTGWRRV